MGVINSNNTIKTFQILWQKFGWLICVILVILLMDRCEDNKMMARNYQAQNDTIEYYKNQYGLQVAQKKTLIGTIEQITLYWAKAKDENKQLKNAVEHYKKIADASAVQTRLQIDSVEIPFAKPVQHPFARKFVKQTDYYSITGEVNDLGININFISENLQTKITGVKKVGLFKNEFRTEITNSNPFVTVTDLENFTFKEKRSRFGIGLFAGLTGGGPSFGVGVTFNLLQF